MGSPIITDRPVLTATGNPMINRFIQRKRRGEKKKGPSLSFSHPFAKLLGCRVPGRSAEAEGNYCSGK